MKHTMKGRLGEENRPAAWGIKTNFPLNVPIKKEAPSPDVKRMLDHLRAGEDASGVKVSLPGRRP